MPYLEVINWVFNFFSLAGSFSGLTKHFRFGSDHGISLADPIPWYHLLQRLTALRWIGSMEHCSVEGSCCLNKQIFFLLLDTTVKFESTLQSWEFFPVFKTNPSGLASIYLFYSNFCLLQNLRLCLTFSFCEVHGCLSNFLPSNPMPSECLWPMIFSLLTLFLGLNAFFSP